MNKLKLSVRYYLANYKSDQVSNIIAEYWELVNDIILQLALFFVTKEFNRNNLLLLSVIPHAKSLTQFVKLN